MSVSRSPMKVRSINRGIPAVGGLHAAVVAHARVVMGDRAAEDTASQEGGAQTVGQMIADRMIADRVTDRSAGPMADQAVADQAVAGPAMVADHAVAAAMENKETAETDAAVVVDTAAPVGARTTAGRARRDLVRTDFDQTDPTRAGPMLLEEMMEARAISTNASPLQTKAHSRVRHLAVVEGRALEVDLQGAGVADVRWVAAEEQQVGVDAE